MKLREMVTEMAMPKVQFKLNKPMYALYDKKADKFGYSDMGWAETGDTPKKSGMADSLDGIKRKHANIIRTQTAKAEDRDEPSRTEQLTKAKAAKKWVIVEMGIKEVK
jgi:hypothetical protein